MYASVVLDTYTSHIFLANVRLEKHPPRPLHFLNRASKVPGASEAPLDIPSYACCHSVEILRNGSIDLRPPTRQPFFPRVEFSSVICKEIAGDVHGLLQADISFFLDDGYEVVGRVTTCLFFVVTVDILEREGLSYISRRRRGSQ